MNNARYIVRAILFLLVAVPSTSPAYAAPNLIVFIADDMAWDDAGAYGHPHIQTPNIDRLARQGMRFDRAFLTTSSCSPSRSSILTGRYPHSTDAGELHLPLPANQVILTEHLLQKGYHTAAAGKWHLGNPTRDKFDTILGVDRSGGDRSGCEKWVDALADRPRDKPFFLWLAAKDPHRNYQKNTIPNPHSPGDVVLPPYIPDLPGVREDFAMYYDEIARMDSYIGKVLDELDRQGIADNTCIIFMSDNGRPFTRAKTTLYDSGIRTPFIIRYPGVIESGATTNSIISAVDLAPTILELADATPMSSSQGHSFAKLLTDPETETREYAFAEHNWHDFTARERSVRSKHYLYIRNEYADLPGTPPADAVRSPTHQAMIQAHENGELMPDQ
ncbi:MAG: sulfatase, partial [Candidatus Hydrogenedentota bacterium]